MRETSLLTSDNKLTLNDVLMQMMDFSFSSWLEIMPSDTPMEKFKRAAAKDVIKHARTVVFKEIQKMQEDEIRKGFQAYAKFATELARRIETWDGQNIEQLQEGLEIGGLLEGPTEDKI